MSKTVIAIVGPTGSGKTKLSIDLALEVDGEVISCDSRNIYKFMDIGTAKPTASEMKGVKHHLIDVAEPDQVFTVADYKRLGEKAIDSIFSREKVPIVAGGTGFYSRALLEGLSIPEVAPNHEFREKLNTLAAEFGGRHLHEMLRQKDPVSAEKINQNDLFRIIRALEVMEELNIPFSKAVKKEKPPFDVVWFGLTFSNRENLKKRIEERLVVQIKDGLETEVKELYEKYGKTQSLTNAVTYKQFIKYFESEISYEEAIEECVKHNYQLARKQLMWFRSNPEMIWLEVDENQDLLNSIREKCGLF